MDVELRDVSKGKSLTVEPTKLTMCFHLLSLCPWCQGSDGELRADRDGASDSESKADSGVPDVPVPPDDTPEVLNKALSGLSSRYRSDSQLLTAAAQMCLNSV